MKKSPADFARQLLRKAENDLIAARIGFEHDAPIDTVCFHVQQAAEKVLKACLAAADLDYPFTHDLRELLELAIPRYSFLEDFRTTLPEYTEFAVRLRYDDLPWITAKDAENAYKVVKALWDKVRGELPAA